LFTAHLPLPDLVRATTLHDRHPPVMFLLLRMAESLGQSEIVTRLPAAIAGTLIGPAILGAARWFRPAKTLSLAAVCAALAVTASPVLVERSREVSELMLFGLLAVITVGATL